MENKTYNDRSASSFPGHMLDGKIILSGKTFCSELQACVPTTKAKDHIPRISFRRPPIYVHVALWVECHWVAKRFRVIREELNVRHDQSALREEVAFEDLVLRHDMR